MSMRSVSEAEFQAGIRPEGVTLVDFGAEWCPPCKVLLPRLKELDAELEGAVPMLKVDVDESPALAEAFGVMSMPTVIVFKDGQPVEKLVGLQPKTAYRNVLARHMPEAAARP
ncbi:MAG: thioredoxin [Paenibacillaceae bacterium]|uniref:thioredoxin n=1 Tax=Paenibacillus cymbidii TaxID=1639034 RepID=UPI001080B9D0|nr:thioredoxin [Paenibacillus cymbidii]MBO9606079.1 thioredoxin [Paenibacillaceae bacterium]